MTLPVHRRPAAGPERAVPAWPEPFTAQFDDLFERMNQLLLSAGRLPPPVDTWVPMADVSETDAAYLVEAELPGVKRDDIDVEVAGRELHISSELKERERTGVFRHRTRRVGQFDYRLTLPAEFRAEAVAATLEDGVLTVTVPKTTAVKSRHVRISS